MFWKKLVAGVVAVVSAVVLGLLIIGIISLFPLSGTLLVAGLIGGLALVIGRLTYQFGEFVCEKVFGWFF